MVVSWGYNGGVSHVIWNDRHRRLYGAHYTRDMTWYGLAGLLLVGVRGMMAWHNVMKRQWGWAAGPMYGPYPLRGCGAVVHCSVVESGTDAQKRSACADGVAPSCARRVDKRVERDSSIRVADCYSVLSGRAGHALASLACGGGNYILFFICLWLNSHRGKQIKSTLMYVRCVHHMTVPTAPLATFGYNTSRGIACQLHKSTQRCAASFIVVSNSLTTMTVLVQSGRLTVIRVFV